MSEVFTAIDKMNELQVGENMNLEYKWTDNGIPELIVQLNFQLVRTNDKNNINDLKCQYNKLLKYIFEDYSKTGNLEYRAEIMFNNFTTDGFVPFGSMLLSTENDGSYSFKHNCGSRQSLASDVYKTKADKSDSYNFTQELIYNGRVGDDVKFVYREYSNDMARSAFSQQAQYDLNLSNIINCQFE